MNAEGSVAGPVAEGQTARIPNSGVRIQGRRLGADAPPRRRPLSRQEKRESRKETDQRNSPRVRAKFLWRVPGRQQRLRLRVGEFQ